MKHEQNPRGLSAYMIGRAGPVAETCGVVVDLVVIAIWFAIFATIVDTVSRYDLNWFVVLLLLGTVYWTWLRITRAWHHSQKEKERKRHEQEELEKVYLERATKN